MRIITLFAFFVLLWPAKVVGLVVPPFVKHHTFEFSVTPGFDYHFVTWPGRSTGFAQQANNAFGPLAGVNLGIAYIYRPVYYVGFSTGFNYLSFNSTTKADFYNPFGFGTEEKGFTYQGFISVPLLIHAYCPAGKTTMELATGPEFLFPVYANYKLGTGNSTFSNKETYTPSQMKMYSWLSYTVQLCANIPIKNSFSLSVGPEMKFLPIYPLKPGPYYNNIPHQIDYYVGIKLGFRLGTNFDKKTAK